MDIQKFKTELANLLEKYTQDVHAIVLGLTYNDGDGNLMSHGFALAPIKVRDHEEEILRDNISEKVSKLASELTRIIYVGRDMR